MGVTIRSVDVVTEPDWDADTSYLDQDEFEDRRDAYKRGDFRFVGVRAVARIAISVADSDGQPSAYNLTQTITSPGLWGIEDDSGDDFFAEIGREELADLRLQLGELGVTADDLAKWFD